MDDRTDALTRRLQENLARLREMRHVGTAGLEQLCGELARAEERCDAPRTRALLADIQTIEAWLAWVAREEWRLGQCD